MIFSYYVLGKEKRMLLFFSTSLFLSIFLTHFSHSSFHSLQLWVMVDVVANHVGPVDDDFSQIHPFNKSEHYHSKCEITDFGNQPQVNLISPFPPTSMIIIIQKSEIESFVFSRKKKLILLIPSLG